MNERHPRTEPGVFKLPSALKAKVEQICAKEHRSVSSVFYYLLVRGTKAYLEDGMLIEDAEDELAFLEKLGTPVVTARQRGTQGKKARV
jgi:hypothetical protein